MIRQSNDNPALLPQGRRKATPIRLAKDGGGKWTADYEQVYQPDLFDGSAAGDVHTSTRSRGMSKRALYPLPVVCHPANKTGQVASATVEKTVERLDIVQRNVVANSGSPGPNRYDVATVRTHWIGIKPKLVPLCEGDLPSRSYPAGMDAQTRAEGVNNGASESLM